MRAAIAAMRVAFVALDRKMVHAPQRLAIESDAGVTLLMGAAARDIGLVSKTVSIFDHNNELGKPVVNGLLLVLDPETGEPTGLCDGAALTAIRTGAVSGAVTDTLAAPQARIAALIGSGVQARTQLLAMDAVRSLDEIRVCGLDLEAVQNFIEQMQRFIKAPLVATASSKEAVANADIVTTATNSKQPVINGEDLKPGCHVNGVGSYTLDMQELDRATIEGAHIYVDQIEAALHESGELVDAESAGLTRRNQWTEIGQLFRQPDKFKNAIGTRSVFKSVGHAVQDVAAASAAFKNAHDLGLGTTIEF